MNSKNIFLKLANGTYTYADLNKFTLFFQAFLKDKQISNRKPVGILASPGDETILIIASCWRLGIPFICFNPNEKNEVISEQINLLKPGIIFTDNQELHNKGEPFTNIHRFNKNKFTYNENKVSPSVINIRDENTFAYLFTSGTTSAPKIVPLKRRQMLTAARASAHNIKLKPNDFWLLCMPLHHIGGISIILRSLIYGSAVYRVNSPKSLSKILSEDEMVKAVSLVPTMLKRLLDDDTFRPHEQLRILLGGGPVHASLLKKALKRNINLITSYGMTETCAQIAAGFVNSSSINKGSVGAVFEPNDIQIRGENGKLQKANKSGIIWLKGPQVFDGYYQTNDKPFFDKNGWFKTGDFGRINKNENLFIESRRTDLIVSGGENVSPPEVEEALLNLREIKEAAVIGLPDDEWGQIVAAAVVFQPKKEMSFDAIKAALKASMAGYKIPKKMVSVKALPRNSTGKVKRVALKKLFIE